MLTFALNIFGIVAQLAIWLTLVLLFCLIIF